MEEEVKQKKKMQWKTMIGFAIGFGIVSLIPVLTGNTPYKKLVNSSKEINEKGAVQMDEDTKFDSTSVIKEPLTLVYHYTIVTVNKDSLAVDLNDTKKVLRKQSQENLDTAPEMEDFRSHDISLKYDYKDKNGKPLFDFTIKPAKNIQ